jgi:hypothetical protein
MSVPEIKKDHEWCPHAAPGHGGCLIYKSRPERCREFHCMWLIDQRFPDYWYPFRSKIVIHAFEDNGRSYVSFVVDPAYPNRWREEPYFSDIKKLAAAGLAGVPLSPMTSKKWTTFVLIKDQRIPIIGTPTMLRRLKATAAPLHVVK